MCEIFFFFCFFFFFFSDGALMKYVKFQTHVKGELQMMRGIQRVQQKLQLRQGKINNLLQKNRIAGSGSRFALGVGVHG